MASNSKTVSADALAAKTLAVSESYSITSLICLTKTTDHWE